MLFSTFDFLVFIVPVLLVFWAIAHRPVARVLFLLGASYFFYMAGPATDPPPTPWYYAGLLVFSTVLDYVCAHRIHASKAKRVRNLFLVLSLTGNLGLLAYFKYTDFFVATFVDIANSFGLGFTAPAMRTILPLGISFYTFQSLSYTIDVWRGRLTPEPSFRKFALFVTFFPQLVAGPIVRASEFLPQLHRRPELTATRMTEGLFRFFKGLAKKVILGDYIAAQFTDAVFSSPESYTSPELLLALYAFTLQLYADFSGYSDMAIGIGRLLGFTIPENFDRPHQARNLGEFWRRWHMTLSTWLRDYLFFPLGGSRGTPQRTYFNLWLTMFLVGMWHYKTGTSWNFVIYANLQAFAIVFNRWNRIRDRGANLQAKALLFSLILLVVAPVVYVLMHVGLDATPWQAGGFTAFVVAMFLLVSWLPQTGTPINTAIHVLLTFHFTVLSRVFFRAESFEGAKRMVTGLLTFEWRWQWDWPWLVLDGPWIRPGLLSPWVWLLLIGGLAYHFTPRRWIEDTAYAAFRRLPGPVIGLLFALLGLALMRLMAGAPRRFIYFDF